MSATDEDPRAQVLREIRTRTGLDEDMSHDMEVGIFNWAVARAEDRKVPRNWRNRAFRLMYDAKARSVIANVDPGEYVANDYLLERVRRGEIKPHEVATSPAFSIFPERWKDVLAASSERDKYIARPVPAGACVTDQFKCGRCKQRECSYMEMQTRSCDEPASIFIQCLSCGHRWRVG